MSSQESRLKRIEKEFAKLKTHAMKFSVEKLPTGNIRVDVDTAAKGTVVLEINREQAELVAQLLQSAVRADKFKLSVELDD